MEAASCCGERLEVPSLLNVAGEGGTIRVVVVSDTHNLHDHVDVPNGDVLLHCGDMTNKGTAGELTAFNDWLGTLPHPHKFFVLGNHEMGLFTEWDPKLISNAVFVDNRSVTVGDVSFYGCPWKGETAAAKHLPPGTDVFFTHAPPAGILDGGEGNETIRDLIAAKRPRVALFGHVHTAHGNATINGGIVYANCANASNPGFHAKEAKHPAVWFDIDAGKEPPTSPVALAVGEASAPLKSPPASSIPQLDGEAGTSTGTSTGTKAGTRAGTKAGTKARTRAGRDPPPPSDMDVLMQGAPPPGGGSLAAGESALNRDKLRSKRKREALGEGETTEETEEEEAPAVLSESDAALVILLKKRHAARTAKDFPLADSLRASLLSLYGVELNDRANTWVDAEGRVGTSDGPDYFEDRAVRLQEGRTERKKAKEKRKAEAKAAKGKRRGADEEEDGSSAIYDGPRDPQAYVEYLRSPSTPPGDSIHQQA